MKALLANFFKADSSQIHATVRHVLWIAAALVAFFIVMSRVFPAPPAHVIAPSVSFTASPIERELQAAIDASKALAAVRSPVVSPLVQPAVTVLRDTGAVSGLSDAQIALLIGALKPQTAEAVAVKTTLAAPTPAPTPSDAAYQHVFDAAYAADTKALNETTIKTSVDITRQEVAPSRVGSLIDAQGSGISYAVWRRKQLEAEIAAVAVQSHLAPAACFHYLIPHTELSVGPCIVARTPVRLGFGAVVHF